MDLPKPLLSLVSAYWQFKVSVCSNAHGFLSTDYHIFNEYHNDWIDCKYCSLVMLCNQLLKKAENKHCIRSQNILCTLASTKINIICKWCRTVFQYNITSNNLLYTWQKTWDTLLDFTIGMDILTFSHKINCIIARCYCFFWCGMHGSTNL